MEASSLATSLVSRCASLCCCRCALHATMHCICQLLRKAAQVVFLTNWRARDRVSEGIHKDTKTFQPPSFLALMGNDPQGAIAAGFVKEDHQAMVRLLTCTC